MSVRKIAVCDDVAIERDMLCMLLHKCDKKTIIYKFASGEALLSSRKAFDLVFLDIYMDGMTGMETAKMLQKRNSKTPIVFLTSSPDFAVESYEIHAFDYIVKPLRPERLKAVWERFLSQYRQSPKFLVLNCPGKTEKLPYEQIEFLESDCHYVTIHMADGAMLRINGRLDDFEQQLDDVRFLRCHKSYLINLNLAEAMDEDFIMHSGNHVAYRKREKKQLQKTFCDYMQKEVQMQ